jgi:hypothetical protein
MHQITETPAVGAVRGSEELTNAGWLGASEDAFALDDRQDLGDPLRIIRTHWGLGLADLMRAGGCP